MQSLEAGVFEEFPEHPPGPHCKTPGLQEAHVTETIAGRVHQQQSVVQSNGTVIVRYNTSEHRSLELD
jgi:hypothetical protein